MVNSSISSSPIQSILLARHMQGRAPGESFTASSLPGHLLHFVLSGRVRQKCNDRTYELLPGSVLWYHEDEWVEGEVLEGPWEFYSINFIAPSLAPPRFEKRFFAPAPEGARESFEAVVNAFNLDTASPRTRLLRVHAYLLLLLDLLTNAAASDEVESAETSSLLWWKLETRVRKDLRQEIDLKRLEEWSGCSAATIARASQTAVGTSPMRRIKQVRLSFARGLVQLSDLTFSQIAERVGYGRVHEFSRDYRNCFGAAPSQDRKLAMQQRDFNGE